MDTHPANTNDQTNAITPHSTKNNKEISAIRLNRKREKIARFESHLDFLRTCIKDNLTPTNFKVILKPSIGNHDLEFLDTWNKKIQALSTELMEESIKFCEKTIDKTNQDINDLEKTLTEHTDPDEFNNIQDLITKTTEERTKSLQQIKINKIKKLKGIQPYRRKINHKQPNSNHLPPDRVINANTTRINRRPVDLPYYYNSKNRHYSQQRSRGKI